MDNEKILLLQLNRFRPVFHTKLNGRAYRKGNRGAKQAIIKFQEQIRSDAKEFFWDILPRARVGVHISLFPSSVKVAGIHNLVKFYLDLLKGIIFKDDRQVHYLSADCYRSGTEKEEGEVYIKVERFCDLISRYEIFHELKHHIDDDFDYSREEDFDIDNDFDEKALRKLGVGENSILKIQRYLKSDKQLSCLWGNKINDFDWPGALKNTMLNEAYLQWDNLNPFVFFIKNLPLLHGQGSNYLERMRKEIENFSSKLPKFGKVISPIDLDVQVRINNRRLCKDLDNIMMDITPIFDELVLSKESHIQGYRIYVTNDQNSGYQSADLRIKILPPYCIDEFENYMEEILEKGEEYLENKI